jgi:hypothetical protein
LRRLKPTGLLPEPRPSGFAPALVGDWLENYYPAVDI